MDDHSASRRNLLLGVAAAAALAEPAAARTGSRHSGQRAAAAPLDESTSQANASTLGVIAGGLDGTYVCIAADLASVLDDGDAMRVLPMAGKGSVQNLADLVRLRAVDLGVVQSDSLDYVAREKLLPNAAQSIRCVAKLYNEEVHILARREIGRVQDLAGKAVGVDTRGSGTALTASVLFSRLGVTVQALNLPQNVALERLRSGEIAALVYVVGKPARLFSTLDGSSGLHFLPVPPNDALLATYLPTQLRSAEYPKLVPEGAPVDTIAVGAVLAAYAWEPGSERYRKIERFVAALGSKFPQLLEAPHHPKWREVNLAARAPGWTPFGVSREVTPAAAPADPSTDAQGTGSNSRRRWRSQRRSSRSEPDAHSFPPLEPDPLDGSD